MLVGNSPSTHVVNYGETPISQTLDFPNFLVQVQYNSSQKSFLSPKLNTVSNFIPDKLHVPEFPFEVNPLYNILI